MAVLRPHLAITVTDVERAIPFYEALFGYDGKLLARTRWGKDEKNLPRKRRGVWPATASRRG